MSACWWTVRALCVLVWFMAVYDITELGQWHAWMDTVGFEEALRESLETLGVGAVVLLWQAKSGRTDHAWVLRFARRALGNSVGEGPAMLAFRDAAEAMGVSQRVLARQVAHWERAAMGVDDAPALRVLWWQCVAESLLVHVPQASGTAFNGDEWRVELSPASALHYAEAGKRIPEDRLVTAFNDIAPLIGESLETLDMTIWYHEKMNMATADVPALRLVWWQMLAYELNRKLRTANDLAPVSCSS